MGETKWTDEQKLAINTRRCNLLVAAAAGSGKTAVLVERIIKIITKEEVDIDKLLVVTFTNAAAAEMRERIAAAISKELEKSPDSESLQRQLTLLSRANITTMHSFCLDVIKNNFHTIDLDPSFRIADDTECTLLKNEILEELFEDLYESENDNFKKLIEAYSGAKDDEKLKEMVLNLYRFSMSGPWPEKWLQSKAEYFNIETLEDLDKTEWIKILKDNIEVELKGLINMMEKAINIINNSSDLQPYFQNFNDELSSIKNAYMSLNGTLSDIYNSINIISFGRLKTIKKTDIIDESIQKIVKVIRDTVKEKIKKLKEDVFSFTPEEALFGIKEVYPFMKSLANLTLEFANRFEDKKRERNLLDFNDLEHLCLKILIKEENGEIYPSEVALKFKEQFDEVLVDEYQDSNNVQETIVELVSRKNDEKPNVFMVGDVKQSIYRFRQAKPELFLEKYNKYPLEAGGREQKIQLYKNFRSREEILAGSNYIFKMLMSNTVGELEYTDEEVLNLGASYKEIDDTSIKVGGPIELHILDKSGLIKEEDKNSTQENDNEESALKEEEEDLDSVALEAKIVSKRIKQLFEAEDGKKFKIFDKNINDYRDLKYKDIVILLRATKNWAEVFLDELATEGIPVYADTGSGYFESIEIRVIMSLLKIIDNPLQDVPLLATLKSPIFNFSVEELSDLRLLDKELYFYDIIEKITENELNTNEELKKKCINFINKLKIWRDRAVYTPIDEFIWYLYKDTAYYGYVGAMSNGKLRQANLKILFQRAKQFESTSFKGLFNFINFINKLRKSSGDMGSAKILGENEDVVRIMSIHKSKGLEFPVVFCSGMGKQFNLMDLNNSILYHEELGFGPDYVDIEKRNAYTTLAKEAIKKRIKLETLSEEMRILYVAFTRAKEKLIITGATRNLEKSIERWASSASLDENIIMPSEVLKGKSYLDWISTAMIKHKDGEPFRNKIGISNSEIVFDLSTWLIDFHNKSSILVDKKIEAVDNSEETLLIDFENISVDKEIKRRLEYEYKFKEVSYLPSNISVSDLKKSSFEENNDEIVEIFKEKEILKPKFLQEEKGLTSAERGTIVHYVMQRLNLDRVSNIGEIHSQIEEMVLDKSLTLLESKTIYYKKILGFYQSDLGRRLIKAHKEKRLVKREFPFFTEISSSQYNLELSEKLYKDEKIRLQGIIDAFFEEDGEIVLLDYKTDYVATDENEIVERYKIQLKYYKDALEKITGKKVKETYLYLFNIDKQVKINY